MRQMFLATLMLVSAGCQQLSHNFRPVETGSFYRSAQMPGDTLRKTISKHGIQTVINLRGEHPDERWYQNEIAACADQGVTHHDLNWSMDSLPPPESLAQYVSWCREAERPILVHCKAGMHRAGVGSAVYVLVRGGTVDNAREQFGLFFLNAPIGNLLDLYEGSSKSFAVWVVTDYPRLHDEATHAHR